MTAIEPHEHCRLTHANKYLFVGDLHCDAMALEQAANIALVHKAKLCLLGDYTSYGPALDIVLALNDILPGSLSVFGNHEYYLARHALLGGRKFSCMNESWDSLNATSQGRHALLRYLEILQTLPAWRSNKQMIWAHGGVDDIMMDEDAPPLGRILKTGHRDRLFNLAMHSRTQNIKSSQTAPTPEWVSKLTICHAFVGHYIRHRDHVSLVQNQHGCITHFVDCGGGKGGQAGLVLMQPDLAGCYTAHTARTGNEGADWTRPEIEFLRPENDKKMTAHVTDNLVKT